MSQWKRLRQSKRRMSSPCTKSTTMLSSPWTLWRPSTHMMTHERSWIFEDVELVLKNMQLGKFFSHRMESYKELTCEFLASMKHHEFDELDRAELDRLGVHNFLAKGEKKMVTFRQLEILFGFTYGEGNHGTSRKNSKEKATGTINEGEVKLLDMGIKPIISRTRMGRRSEEIGHTQGISCLSLSSSKPTRSQLTTLGTKEEESLVLEGWMDIKFCKTNLLIEHKELDGRFQFKFTHPLAGPSKLLLPNPELTTVLGGTNIDFRPPVYTLVGHEADLQEEEIELDRAESS
ncbi:unnamed protein product [Microthlaspi erraticum]|uniref:Arabidopsis retrotransposon Orf1 C-terminal domain-containing protein n=1 Tax=Microthlaspi erraticum TaxID=1685480 RepID=A0A6D2JF18_9BRAS|nr:unnamed protein product [Microthlaspi erraticum]